MKTKKDNMEPLGRLEYGLHIREYYCISLNFLSDNNNVVL